MRRKVIFVTGLNDFEIIALCDDGSMWVKDRGTRETFKDDWKRICDIPQDADEAQTSAQPGDGAPPKTPRGRASTCTRPDGISG